MEMTECGKHGKPLSRLPTLPTLFGNPFGIPTFPRPPRLDYVFSFLLNSSHSHRKGLVTDVSGPQRNACPGTLTANRSNWSLVFARAGGSFTPVGLRIIALRKPGEGLNGTLGETPTSMAWQESVPHYRPRCRLLSDRSVRPTLVSVPHC